MVTRGSFETAYASRPPQENPATAIFVVSIRLKYLLPDREFSATAQSMDWVSIWEFVEPEPFGAPLAMARKPWEAISRRKLPCDRPFAEQAPLPQTRTGRRSDGSVWGRKTVWLGRLDEVS
ncbi:hypothetical protein [Micromonospora tulbaghiae]|uniref:hypothetical protein n=1 Tax=Micromonospora tulbaghiae TaxID=479978 RepID=UPI001FC9E0B5|nr:hypothetical protein [Micromonospora tulbaghiae]